MRRKERNHTAGKAALALLILGFLGLPLQTIRAEDDNRESMEVTALEFSVGAESSEQIIDEMMAFSSKEGGYLVTLRSGYAEFRIPARLGRERVEGQISSIPGTFLYQSSRETSDVAGEMVDLRARLKVAEENLAKLRALSGSAGLDDLLDLERALNRSLEEVESLKGQINYLKESSSLFAVKIRINASGGTSDPEKVRIPWVRSLTLNGIMGGLE